jgi:hypothetical protein
MTVDGGPVDVSADARHELLYPHVRALMLLLLRYGLIFIYILLLVFVLFEVEGPVDRACPVAPLRHQLLEGGRLRNLVTLPLETRLGLYYPDYLLRLLAREQDVTLYIKTVRFLVVRDHLRGRRLVGLLVSLLLLCILEAHFKYISYN